MLSYTRGCCLFLATLIFTLVPAQVYAADNVEHMLTITSEFRQKDSNIWIVTNDQNQLTGMYVGEDVATRTYYSSADIAKGANIKIPGVDRDDVFKITATPKSDSEIKITIKYLNNGISGNYKYRDLMLKRNEKGQWQAFDPKGDTSLKALRMTKKGFFGKLIGIDDIQLISLIADTKAPETGVFALGDELPMPTIDDSSRELAKVKLTEPATYVGVPVDSSLTGDGAIRL